MSTTPIFDLKEAPPEPSSSFYLQLLVGGVVGLLLALTPLMKFHYLPSANGLLFLPAMYVSVAIHEVGHLLVGKIVGMPPGGITVGGLVILRSGKRWVVRFDYRRIFSGGFAKVLPANGNFRPAAYAWMVAGGPLASILLTVSCGVAWLRYGSGPWGWIGSVFWLALLTVIGTLIPYSSGINRSDGARLLVLARHPEQARSWMALYAVQTEETRGVVPRNWDAELVRQMLLADPSSSEYSYVQLLAFYRSVNENDEQQALRHLENALAKSGRSGKPLRQCLFLESASASAHLRGNAAQARIWLERACALQKPKSIEGVEAAIAICEERYDEALRHLAACRARLEKLKLDSGLVRFSKEKLTEYEKLCKAQHPTDVVNA